MKGSKPRSGDFKMDGINSTAEHLFQVIPKLGKCQVLLHKHHLWCTGVPAAAQMQHPMLERQLCCILSLGTAVSCLGKDKQQTNKGKNQQWVLKKKKKAPEGPQEDATWCYSAIIQATTNSLVPKTRRKKVIYGGLGCPQSRKAKPQLSL